MSVGQRCFRVAPHYATITLELSRKVHFGMPWGYDEFLPGRQFLLLLYIVDSSCLATSPTATYEALQQTRWYRVQCFVD